MGILHGKQPTRVWKYFEELCAIPHGSGNTKRISDYCVAFAKAHNLRYTQDAMQNVIIWKDASNGYESHPPVIVQGHLDMVCEKEPDSDFDFEADGLRLQTQGDWLCADGTTLGADDGIAVAMALAILEDTKLAHPPLEVVFTVDEEIGLLGAAGLDTRALQARRLLNLDSEEEGVLTIGCAGGATAHITLPISHTPCDWPCYRITVSGLIGGHSGAEIHKGRQNANILMGKLLAGLPFAWRLVDIAGGQKDNAIPRHAVCTIAAVENPTANAAAFADVHRIPADPDLQVSVTPVPASATAVDEAGSATVAAFLAQAKNGVQAMSRQLEGLVETSLNLGVLNTTPTAVCATFSVRSSLNDSKDALLDELRQTAARIGANYAESGHYPAWEPMPNSPLQQIMSAVAEKHYGQKPLITAIHAGLECGLFSDKMPGLDAVSFGPNMQNIHTTEERISLSSVERTYAYLLAVLQAL